MRPRFSGKAPACCGREAHFERALKKSDRFQNKLHLLGCSAEKSFLTPFLRKSGNEMQQRSVCRNGKRRRSLRRLLYDKMSGRRTIFIALMWCLSIIELLGQQITRPTWVNNLHQATQRNLCMHSPAAFLFLCSLASCAFFVEFLDVNLG